MENFIEIEIEKIRERVGNRKVLCAERWCRFISCCSIIA